MSTWRVEENMQDLDVDHSCTIDFEEFITWGRKGRKGKSKLIKKFGLQKAKYIKVFELQLLNWEN